MALNSCDGLACSKRLCGVTLVFWPPQVQISSSLVGICYSQLFAIFALATVNCQIIKVTPNNGFLWAEHRRNWPSQTRKPPIGESHTLQTYAPCRTRHFMRTTQLLRLKKNEFRKYDSQWRGTERFARTLGTHLIHIQQRLPISSPTLSSPSGLCRQTIRSLPPWRWITNNWSLYGVTLIPVICRQMEWLID